MRRNGLDDHRILALLALNADLNRMTAIALATVAGCTQTGSARCSAWQNGVDEAQVGGSPHFSMFTDVCLQRKLAYARLKHEYKPVAETVWMTGAFQHKGSWNQILLK